MDPILKALLEALGVSTEPTAEQTAAIATYGAALSAGLKANNTQLLSDNRKLKDKLKLFDGIDPAELTEALTELDLDAADVIDRLRTPLTGEPKDAAAIKAAAEADAEKKWSRKVTQAEKRATDAEAATAASNKARVDSEIERALTGEIASKKGVTDLLMPMLRGRVKGVIGEDGKITLTVLAANGDEMQGATGASASVADLVETIRRDEKFGMAFEAEGGGTGAGKGGVRKPGSRAVNPWKKETRNLTEQSRIRSENPTLADQLKREAEAA